MTTNCDHVSSGDLITADFINTCILDRLAYLEQHLLALENQAAPGPVPSTTVPDIIGYTIKEAAMALQKAGLVIGKVYDSNKLAVSNTQFFGKTDWIVIDTSPGVGTKVNAGAAVDLTMKSQEPQWTLIGPSITGFKPDSVSVDDSSSSFSLTIIGSNFESTSANNQVIVGGQTAAVKSSLPEALDITTPLPAGLAEGSNQVIVSVKTTAGGPCSATLLVTYRKREGIQWYVPTFTQIVDTSGVIFAKFDPAGPVEEEQWQFVDTGDGTEAVQLQNGGTVIKPGDLMVIQGENFSYDLSGNAVNMVILGRSISLQVVSQSGDGKSITVQMPKVTLDKSKTKMTVQAAGTADQTYTVSSTDAKSPMSFTVVSKSATGSLLTSDPVQFNAAR